MNAPAPSIEPESTRDLHRYPGVRSFEEPDERRFFGRTAATDALLLRVLSVRLLLQFAPSGAGKTSLLAAGLFPRLRPHRCFPFAIRLNDARETLTQAATRSLRAAAREAKLADPVIPEQPNSLWSLLSGVQLWNSELQLLTPVLVFDQFEEVFTLRDEAFRRGLAGEIGELSRGRVSASPEGSVGETPPDAKIIISVREEYLGKLEELAGQIPELFSERMRLAPLTGEEAREAIVEPARLDGDWLSPKFEFAPDCLDALIDFIDGVSEKVHLIEPLTLQLVCRRAEAIAMARSRPQQPATLVLADFGGVTGLEHLVLNHYTNELAKLDGASRRSAVAMFEQGLLDPVGKRLMLEEGQIERDYGVNASVLEALVESRLLRREPRDESIFYEISHDRLTDVIARHRQPRLPEWVRPALGVAAFVILILVLAIVWVTSAKNRADRAQAEAEESKHKATAALGVLLGDDLVARLQEAGLSDTLAQVLERAPPVGSSGDALLDALRLKHEGALSWEREKVEAAHERFESALKLWEASRPDVGSAAKVGRAKALKLLGDALRDRGQMTGAEADYSKAAQLWDQNHADATEYALDAAETRLALGSVKQQLGDLVGAETEYVNGAERALAVVRDAYWHTYDHSERNRRTEAHPERANPTKDSFELGRAMNVYADGALSLARLWSDRVVVYKGARALAAELLRLRPLSAKARVQFGTASAMYGANAVVIEGKLDERARGLFDEAGRQFGELTQFDRSNRRMAREAAAVRMVTAEVVAQCAETLECRKLLRPGEIALAQAWVLDSLGRFRELSKQNPASVSLQQDIAWGLETQAKLIPHTPEGNPSALALFDEILRIERETIVDPRDALSRNALVQTLFAKSRRLEEAHRSDEALRVLDEAIATADALPDCLQKTFNRWDALNHKAVLLSKLQRADEAKGILAEADKLKAAGGEPWRTRRDQKTKLNLEGNELFDKGAALHGRAAAAEFQAAAEKYRAAAKEEPTDQVIWDNLRAAYVQLASRLASESGSAPVPKDAEERESALRGALESAWLAWVLSDDVAGGPDDRARREKTTAALLKLYEARRALALFLRLDSNRADEALALAEEGVRNLERVAVRQDEAGEIALVADAYYGLGMLREETGTAGWEDAMRAAIAHGERARGLEPASSPRMEWLGGVHNELAVRLEKAKQPGADAERALARNVCEAARSAARSDDERSKAQTCIDTALRP